MSKINNEFVSTHSIYLLIFDSVYDYIYIYINHLALWNNTIGSLIFTWYQTIFQSHCLTFSLSPMSSISWKLVLSQEKKKNILRLHFKYPIHFSACILMICNTSKKYLTVQETPHWISWVKHTRENTCISAYHARFAGQITL